MNPRHMQGIRYRESASQTPPGLNPSRQRINLQLSERFI